jgi:hypothetical protein
MQEEIKNIFQSYIGRAMGLLEMTGNEALKRELKKVLWDLSDDIQEKVIKKEEIKNDTEKTYNR